MHFAAMLSKMLAVGRQLLGTDIPSRGIRICRTPSTPKITLTGILAEPGPLCSTLPRISIILGIIAPAIVSRDCVRNPKGGSVPNSKDLIAGVQPTARPAMHVQAHDCTLITTRDCCVEG